MGSEPSILEFYNFSGSHSHEAFRVSNCKMERGERWVIQGISDAVRTAVFKYILGFNKDFNGQLFYKGNAINSYSNKEILHIRRTMGYAAARNGLLKNLSIIDNILLPLQVRDDANDAVMFEKANKLREKLKISAHPFKEAWGLSRLDEKKICIARAMIHQPQLLLLDEPTLYLEKKDLEEMYAVILEHVLPMNSSATCLISTDDVQLSTYVDANNLWLEEDNE